MQKNNVLNKPVEGEDVFLSKWSKLSKDVDVRYYRCFSHYTGNNPNILSGDISVNYIEPLLNPINYRDYYEDKNNYGRLFDKEIQPKTFLRRINGIYFDEDYNELNCINDNILQTLLNNVTKCIVKPSVGTSSGVGVRLFLRSEKKGGGGDYSCGNDMLNVSFLEKEYLDNFIIQECVEQSEFLSKFNLTSVNTLRVVTYRSVTDNKVYIANRILRVGAKGSYLDNAHAGGMLTSVDSNGVLGNYFVGTFGEKTSIYNNIDFGSNYFRIDNIEEVDTFAKSIASKIYHHRLVALDIALDKWNKPILIEYNISGFGYWPFQLSGYATLEGFTDEIIDYCKMQNDYTLLNLRVR